MIDDSRCNRTHSSLIAVRCFDNGYMGKKPVAWKGYFAEQCKKKKKKFRKAWIGCTGRRIMTEITWKTALNTIQSIDQEKYRVVRYTYICLFVLQAFLILRQRNYVKPRTL